MKFKIIILSLFVLLAQILVAGGKHGGHDHDDHIKPSRGGEMLEVGNHVAFIELVHDEKNGKMTLYILDKEGKSLYIEKSPRLNIKYKVAKIENKKQLMTKGLNLKHNKSYEFEISHDILKGDDYVLVVSLKINKKSYRVNLEHSHHEGGDHDGHKHDDHSGHKH